MSSVAFSSPQSRLPPHLPTSSSKMPMPPVGSSYPAADLHGSNFADDPGRPQILLRRLPRNTTPDAVRTMLLFAKDLLDVEMVPNRYLDDDGFATAVARFASMAGAAEAQSMLHGKQFTPGQAKLIVNVDAPPSAAAGRRAVGEPRPRGTMAQSRSPPMANAPKPSRFNGTFQSMDKTSPPPVGSPSDLASSDSSTPLQTLFSPHSPVSSTTDRSRVSGKKVIDEDGGDDDTGELLKDPLAYMNSSALGHPPRNAANARIPTTAFAALSLNTSIGGGGGGGGGGGAATNYTSPRSAAPARTPHSQFTPGFGLNGQFAAPAQPYIRHNYPPVNPADQNPPCNTLYVGNLPIDTSEDELKAMFSKQRGYKRLCFRTKQNGPMCFVEFEDVSFATKALNELYGAQLHNSVKGGIRLSFSKNPLGVRAGQSGSAIPTSPLSIAGPTALNGFGSMTPAGFSTASGPPPGLSAPPGLNVGSNGGGGVPSPTPFVNQGYVGPGGTLRGLPTNSPPTSTKPGGAGIYPDYMLGR